MSEDEREDYLYVNKQSRTRREHLPVMVIDMSFIVSLALILASFFKLIDSAVTWGSQSMQSLHANDCSSAAEFED